MVNKAQSNFRIIDVNGLQLLLERVEEDEGWEVIKSVFINEETRYDEWTGFESIEAACSYIEQFSLENAQACIQRASQDLASKMNQRVNPFVDTSLN